MKPGPKYNSGLRNQWAALLALFPGDVSHSLRTVHHFPFEKWGPKSMLESGKRWKCEWPLKKGQYASAFLLLRWITELLVTVISGGETNGEMLRWRHHREFQMGNIFMKHEWKIGSVKSDAFPISGLFLIITLFGELIGSFGFYFCNWLYILKVWKVKKINKQAVW